jgi:H+-transporting ATPase
MLDRTTDEYLELDGHDVLTALRANDERGLDSAEANRRLEDYGPNEIEEREESIWHRIFRRFWGPIPWMI